MAGGGRLPSLSFHRCPRRVDAGLALRLRRVAGFARERATPCVWPVLCLRGVVYATGTRCGLSAMVLGRVPCCCATHTRLRNAKCDSVSGALCPSCISGSRMIDAESSESSRQSVYSLYAHVSV